MMENSTDDGAGYLPPQNQEVSSTSSDPLTNPEIKSIVDHVIAEATVTRISKKPGNITTVFDNAKEKLDDLLENDPTFPETLRGLVDLTIPNLIYDADSGGTEKIETIDKETRQTLTNCDLLQRIDLDKLVDEDTKRRLQLIVKNCVENAETSRSNR